MLRRRVFVADELDVVRASSPDGERRRIDLDPFALLERRALQNDEGAERAGSASEPDRRRLLRCEDEALLWQPHFLGRTADDPPDEEVEQDEEAELEDEEDRLDRDGREHQERSRRNEISVEPIVILSPWSSFARCVRSPFTSKPFVESRSTIQYAVPS